MWHGKVERAAPTRGVVRRRASDPHLAVMSLDDLLDDRETQAGAFETTRRRAVHLVESFKDTFLFLGWHANAFIGNRNLDDPVFHLGLHFDFPTLGAELERVAEQLVKNLFQAAVDDTDSQITVGQFQGDLDAEFLRHSFSAECGLAGQLGE